jgi:O-acetyl-ADP-ribose deacetylase (regulator of RNase III)
MSFREVEGDLFERGFPAIGHGVNCRGVMGAGIAKEFRRRFPVMYQIYREKCEAGELYPGYFHAVPIDNVWIFNLATQQDPGADATLLAVETSVYRALRSCKLMGIRTLGVPRIGCGIGGLEWPDVREVLRGVVDMNPEVDLVAVTLPGEADDPALDDPALD